MKKPGCSLLVSMGDAPGAAKEDTHNECKVVVEQSCHEARECVMEANGHRIGASHELYISYEE